MATGSGPPGHTGPFVSLGSHTVDLRVYPKFREIAAADPSCAPRRRALSWVLKSIDDIYDAYAAAAAAWEQQAQDYLTEPRPPPCETGFPPFVYRFWRKRYGSKALVLQACLELVCCVDLWRTRNSDVELFARLLEEYYTTQELTCIVGLRAALRDVVGVHWKQLWLGGQACIPYARALAAGRAVLGRGRGEVDGAALVKEYELALDDVATVRGMYNAPPSPPPRHHTSAAHHGAALSTTPPPLPGAPRGSLTAHALALAAAASATPAAERRLSIQASTNQMAAMASPASQRRRSRSPSSTNQQRPSLSPANRRRRCATVDTGDGRGGGRGRGGVWGFAVGAAAAALAGTAAAA
ncbi:hypothetical protein JKP88DRAFT_288039 [Tribonema minus]|uniref:Uncharacterized protein n=1 Tax=Tribonema minus TaxID=303371 RepID=A0A835ZCA1_9STRA|nr:hypothetical protein JKP88DRAFT_288039 [Tribonema minus]